MNWIPATPHHAIERVRVIVQFRENVPGKIARQMGDIISKQRNELNLEGPTPVAALNFSVKISPKGQPSTLPSREGTQGWQFARSSTVGEILETIVTVGQQVIYETTEYHRWSDFKDRFEAISAASIELADNALDLDSIAIEYYDRFIFNGDKNSARPLELLACIDKILPQDVLDGKSLWHLHRGWYETRDNGQVLVNQNFDAQDVEVIEQNAELRSIAVLTKVELRSGKFSVHERPVLGWLDYMHSISNSHFEKALSVEMRNLLGMNKENTK